MKPYLFALLTPLMALAQTPAPTVPPVWDVAQTATVLAAQADRLRPLLDQLTPEQWVQKGAPPAYASQRDAARDQLGYLDGAAEKLAKQPERLTAALETLFRLQALEASVTSLAEGVRKYQNPAVGDLLVSILGENSSTRDKLRNYITDLAEQREQEFAIVDQEAQRCRTELNRLPRK